MTGPVAIPENVERTLSFSNRTRSLDSVSFRNNDTTSNGDQTARSSTESVAFRYGDLKLPNGECYSGHLLGNVPEGSGTYVWSRGCKYEGEWRHGRWHGYGKLRWPSGARYEGEFSCGYMQGTGTYVRSDRLVYKGRWRLNRKHGLGFQTYPNRDSFEGSWIQGSPDGPGKYTWANGNEYLGNMKGGKMSGKGTFTWTNGDSYEGSWSNGVMHGFGAYTWSDGGRYVGTWTRGLKDGKGAFYPNGCRLPARQELYLKALRKRGLLSDLQKVNQVSRIQHASSIDMGNFKVGGGRSSSQRNNNVSLERRWSLEVAIEKVMGNDLASYMSDAAFSNGDDDTKTPILEREYMQGILISELVVDSSFSNGSKREMRRQRKLVREVKRPGEAIIKGHRSYDLMLSLQLGIRYTVGKITPVQKREVRVSDFGPRASFWMQFPKEGSQLTPTHQSEDFKWKDYCPMVFRLVCYIDPLVYILSNPKSNNLFCYLLLH